VSDPAGISEAQDASPPPSGLSTGRWLWVPNREGPVGYEGSAEILFDVGETFARLAEDDPIEVGFAVIVASEV